MQVPGTVVSDTHLGANEVATDLSTRNKSSHNRVSPVPPLNELISTLLQMITSTIDKERSFVPFKNDVTVLLVNNLGGLSELELGRVVVEVRRAPGKSRIQIMHLLSASGSFVVCSVHNLHVWIDDNPLLNKS
jgi:dihydroxyacetone kinase